MMVLDIVELAFKLPHLGLLSIHLLVGAVSIFIEMVDHKCGVIEHHEVFNTELYGYADTV
jgi:hypothetical protein